MWINFCIQIHGYRFTNECRISVHSMSSEAHVWLHMWNGLLLREDSFCFMFCFDDAWLQQGTPVLWLTHYPASKDPGSSISVRKLRLQFVTCFAADTRGRKTGNKFGKCPHCFCPQRCGRETRNWINTWLQGNQTDGISRKQTNNCNVPFIL